MTAIPQNKKSTKNQFLEWVLFDLFPAIPNLTSKAMFGGYGLYSHGHIFGIIVKETLYLKVGEVNQADYQNGESRPFQYIRPDGTVGGMSYWTLPTEVLEHPDQARVWAEKAIKQSLLSKKSR